MTRPAAIAPRAVAVALLGLVFAACSPAAATVAPSASVAPTDPPTVAPTVAATTAPMASPSTATAGGSARPDPAVGLEIAAPYALTALDPALEATLSAQLGQLGAVGGLFGVGGRSILNDGKAAGFVQVIGLPPGMLTDAMYTTLLDAIGPSTGQTFTTDTVAGVTVSKAATPTGGLSIFHFGDLIIMTVVPSGEDLDAVTKALIDANK